MNSKLDSYLVEKYPKIFINRYEDMKKTSMCWGFQTRDGWFWLIDQLCNSIQNYIDINNKYIPDKKISQIIATQVKEKFGMLDFSFTGGDDYVRGMANLAIHMSLNICEFCGTTTNVGSTKGAWIYTICKDCYNNSDDRIKQLPWKESEQSEQKNIMSKELRKIKLDKLNENIK